MTRPGLIDAMVTVNDRKRAAGATPEQPTTIDARLLVSGHDVDQHDLTRAIAIVGDTQRAILTDHGLADDWLETALEQAAVTFVEGLAVGLALAQLRRAQEPADG